MGAIREIELSNGNVQLEITYGGKEAPFGGVDTSAPPAYIDPRCFAAANGFLIVDNKLVATSLVPLNIPPLWGGMPGITFLGFGTFYNSIYGQLNYIIGYTATAFSAEFSSGVNYVFYITSWNPGNVAQYWNDTLDVTLYDTIETATAASLVLPCIEGPYANPGFGTGATANITAVGPLGALTTAGTSITGGINYVVGTGLIVQQGLYTGAVEITSVDVHGAITGIVVTTPGTGFTVGAATASYYGSPSATIKFPTLPGTPQFGAGGSNVAAVVTELVTQINLEPLTIPYVVASSTADNQSLILTAVTPGSSGNTIEVIDIGASIGGGIVGYYFPCVNGAYLRGGIDNNAVLAPRAFTSKIATAEVGGTLYIANIGPMILKFSGPGTFQYSTFYSGYELLNKFAGSLIGARIIPQLGIIAQDSDMSVAWTAANELDVWAPETAAGLVTGAGFAQIDDIGDYLSGLIVSNGTMYLLRAQGISYATPTGNATLPFSFNHIGLGDRGEGAQLSSLVCQYDNTGAYIGNSNIYQISGSISAIGDKIKAAIFSALDSIDSLGVTNLISSAAGAALLGGDEFPIVAFSVVLNNGTLNLVTYVYNVTNGTWMPFTYASGVGMGTIQTALTGVLSSLLTFADSNLYNQSNIAFGFQQQTDGVPGTPSFFALQEGIPNSDSILTQAGIIFPAEEVSFGRDITIDALYLALVADVSEIIYVDFYVNNTLYATLELDPSTYNTLAGNPIESALFASTYGVGAFTTKSPQLSFKVRSLTDTGTAQIRFTKVQMYASYDPMQRPT